MKKLLFITIILLFSVQGVSALSITTSASGNFFGDQYSYTFSIDDGDTNDGIFTATLENTSDSSLQNALIDLIAFNMDAEIVTDFTIENISPNWSFTTGSGGVQFDYVGDSNSPGDKIGPGETLTFDFDFVDGYIFPADPFTLWTGTASSAGTGIGGGEDIGQVAVSFQQLGATGDDSDLLASDWNPAPVPEPATMLLLGSGLIGVAATRRKQKK